MLMITSIMFVKVKTKLKSWKELALADGSNPDALLFYFCGHGGKLGELYINFVNNFSFPGHLPFESSAAHEEYEDTLVFSGSVGNIGVGGDVLIDNDGMKMFKDEIMQTICKVGFNLYEHWI